MRRAEIEEQNRFLIERQRQFRMAADVATETWMAFPEVQAIAVIGSVAGPGKAGPSSPNYTTTAAIRAVHWIARLCRNSWPMSTEGSLMLWWSTRSTVSHGPLPALPNWWSALTRGTSHSSRSPKLSVRPHPWGDLRSMCCSHLPSSSVNSQPSGSATSSPHRSDALSA